MTSPPPSRPDRDRAAEGAGADFFDVDYLRLLAPFHSEAGARSETAALRELLGVSQDERILDLGCGWGRHTALLAEAGHRVVGLDLALPLLLAARASMAGARPGPDPTDAPERPSGSSANAAGSASTATGPAPVVAGDMRALPFPDHTFDLVLNVETSLGLFLDDEAAVRALAEAGRVLVPEGRLLLEGMHRDEVVAGYASRDGWTLDDGTRVRVRRRFDAVRGVSHEVLRWDRPDGDDPGSRGTKRHSLRLRSATELARLVDLAGMSVEWTAGGWWGETFRHDSDRLILVARRSV